MTKYVFDLNRLLVLHPCIAGTLVIRGPQARLDRARSIFYTARDFEILNREYYSSEALSSGLGSHGNERTYYTISQKELEELDNPTLPAHRQLRDEIGLLLGHQGITALVYKFDPLEALTELCRQCAVQTFPFLRQ